MDWYNLCGGHFNKINQSCKIHIHFNQTILFLEKTFYKYTCTIKMMHEKGYLLNIICHNKLWKVKQMSIKTELLKYVVIHPQDRILYNYEKRMRSLCTNIEGLLSYIRWGKKQSIFCIKL